MEMLVEENVEYRRSMLSSLVALPLTLASSALMADAARSQPRSEAGALLAELVARQRITEVMHRYARGMDRADEVSARSAFWSDATVRYGTFDGAAGDYVDFAMNIVRQLMWGAHYVTNIDIHIVGDRAVVDSLVFAHHHRRSEDEKGEQEGFYTGRYVDRMERRDGVWKIAHRRGLRDFNLVIPGASYGDIPSGQHSEKAPNDVFYQMIADMERGAQGSSGYLP